MRKKEQQIKNIHYQAWFNADYIATAVWGGSKSLPKLDEIMNNSIYDKEEIDSDELNEERILSMLSSIQKNKPELNIIIS